MPILLFVLLMPALYLASAQTATGSEQDAFVLRSKPLSKAGNTLDRFAKATPVEKDGQTIGYKLVPIERGVNLFAKHGLLPCDIVTSANGISLVNKDNAIRSLRKLVKAETLHLRILRNGTAKILSIPLR